MIKILRIEKPVKTNLPEVLSGMFGRSSVISEAVSQFWGLGLAKSAKLGDVRELPSYYEVEIIYRGKV